MAGTWVSCPGRPKSFGMFPRASNLLLGILSLNVAWFVLYSAQLAYSGLMSEAPSEVSRAFFTGAPVSNALLAGHMLAGAVLTIGAPLQAMPVFRTRWPQLHRRAGYALFGLAVVTGLAGLGYIALQGTVGGWWMSLWFAVYGLMLIWAAANTIYHALNKDMRRHMEWATRLVILAVGSWIYRMHYAIWFGLTDGIASNDRFTGTFDLIQVFAFYLPYLLLAEVILRYRSRSSVRLA